LRGGIPEFFENAALLMTTSNEEDRNRQAAEKSLLSPLGAVEIDNNA